MAVEALIFLVAGISVISVLADAFTGSYARSFALVKVRVAASVISAPGRNSRLGGPSRSGS
ncbi:hypothetical protein [Nonomuraea sp. NPDC050540]|uniref:hypothetical protein n=1 Tax=Nonomuraea sp. NPDC050540 TaxID=3364367 RepID=UPI0037AE688E